MYVYKNSIHTTSHIQKQKQIHICTTTFAFILYETAANAEKREPTLYFHTNGGPVLYTVCEKNTDFKLKIALYERRIVNESQTKHTYELNERTKKELYVA